MIPHGSLLYYLFMGVKIIVVRHISCQLLTIIHAIVDPDDNHPCFDIVHLWTKSETSQNLYLNNVNIGYLTSHLNNGVSESMFQVMIR